MDIMRTRFPGGIAAEFASPAGRARHARRGKKRGAKVVIICSGLPGGPSKRDYMKFLGEAGFWTVVPRYRGTWESNGTFLKQSPEKDITLVLDAILKKPVRDLWTGKAYRIRPEEVFVFGTSFGGPAALFLSRDPRVTRVVALSPVVDWLDPSKAEPWPKFERYIREAFGPAYRIHKANWNRMKRGKFYNPAAEPERVDGSKVLVVHAKDDKSVGWRPVAKFAKQRSARLVLRPSGGHGSRMFTPALKRRIVRWFEKGA